MRLEDADWDSGIIENASGRRSLGESVRSSLRTLVLRPHAFFFSKPFALIFVRARINQTFLCLGRTNHFCN